MTRPAMKTSDSRQRFIEVALQLFTRHSFAGTSLQMIADRLGVTKSAVHHHFRSREDLLLAVVEPLIGQLNVVIEAAEALHGRYARAERMLVGFVGIVVQHRSLMSLLAGDPGVIDMLRNHPELSGLINRQMALFAAVEPGPGGTIRAVVVARGLSGAARAGTLDLDDNTLRAHLTEIGRHTLGLPRPRRTPVHDASTPIVHLGMQ